jgi:hypothetical protein
VGLIYAKLSFPKLSFKAEIIEKEVVVMKRPTQFVVVSR